MKLDDAIEERHSVRRFSTKKVDWADIIEAVDSANQAPLAGNIATLRFVVITDKTKIQKIAEACQQDFVSDVEYLVVVCSKLDEVKRAYGKRGEMYARQQAGAAIENFLLKITDMGLASCWVGAFVDDLIKDILVIQDEVNVEAVLPIGYEMPRTGKQRKKTSMDNVLYWNKWKEKRMIPTKKVEAF